LLKGHEFPFAIKMNFLREAHRSIKEDDNNSYKFILIDKNANRNNNNKTKQLNNVKPIVDISINPTTGLSFIFIIKVNLITLTLNTMLFL
jgi:hypothetical protein